MRVPLGPCGLDHIRLFEIIVNDYQFVILSAEHGHAVVHKGPPSEKQFMLFMHDGHFDVITKLPGFFDSSYFCLKCERPILRKPTIIIPAVKLNVRLVFKKNV